MAFPIQAANAANDATAAMDAAMRNNLPRPFVVPVLPDEERLLILRTSREEKSGGSFIRARSSRKAEEIKSPSRSRDMSFVFSTAISCYIMFDEVSHEMV